MKVLVTGTNGQVGRALVERTPIGCAIQPMSREQLDICDRRAVNSALAEFAPQVVVNAAAFTLVDQAEANRERAYMVNANAVAQLAEACGAIGARLVHLSTDYVFDGQQGTPYRPGDLPNPLSAYGASKLAGERAAVTSPGALIVRTSWVYSHSGRNFVDSILKALNDKPEIEVVCDQIGTPTSAISLADAIWALVERRADGIHHYTDSGIASWYDFATAIAEEALNLGALHKCAEILPISTLGFPGPAQRPPFSVLDKTATWHLLGRPARHWRIELRETLKRKFGAERG